MKIPPPPPPPQSRIIREGENPQRPPLMKICPRTWNKNELIWERSCVDCDGKCSPSYTITKEMLPPKHPWYYKFIGWFIRIIRKRQEKKNAKQLKSFTDMKLGKTWEPTDSKVLTYCHAGRDGECFAKNCPQLRDNEPFATGRHCPLDNNTDDE